jgi:hypothetical protein
MLKRFLLLCALGLVVLFGVVGVGSAAPNGSLIGIRHVRGTFVYGQFRNQVGNEITAAQIFAGDELTQFGATGPPLRQEIFLHVERGTASVLAMSADCSGDADLYRVSGLLSAASIRGTATCLDYLSNTTFSLSVDLMATATSDPQHVNEHSLYVDGGRIEVAAYNATFRDAVVSGTISDGVTNFTPAASNAGSIVREQDGFFVVAPPGLGK